jgi:DNA-binding NarL/FixJ family response regulator
VRGGVYIPILSCMEIRVIVVEDNLLIREGLVGLLGTDPEIKIVASCADLPEAVTTFRAESPDVVLTDIRMPPSMGDEGIKLAELVRNERPSTGVVILSQYDEPQYAMELFKDGSEGRAYLLKERVSDPQQIFEAIRSVSQGGSVIDPKVVDALVRARSAKSGPLDSLTPREREVLEKMAQGKSNAAISEDLVLTVRAVEKHINSIFGKLGLTQETDVHKRVTAVLLLLGG